MHNLPRDVFIGMLSFTVICSSAVDAQRFDQLAFATKRIADIYSANGELTSDNKLAVAKLACDALTAVYADPTFGYSIQNAIGRASPQDRTRGRQLISSVADFIGEFRLAEREAIVKAHFDPSVADEAFSAAASVRERAATAELSANEILMSVLKLRDLACGLQVQIRTDAQSLATRRRLALTVMGLSGVVLVIADATTAVPTAGASAASMALGSTVLSAAFAEPR